MEINYDLIENANIQDLHRETFERLLKIQNKVKGNLSQKAGRCKIICIASLDEYPIAIGAIKPKTRSDFSKDKADLPSFFDDFDWELGYLFTLGGHTGKGIASNMVKLLINEFGNNNLMASTEIKANPAMVTILKRNGFEHYGKIWKSRIHTNDLGLFLRFREGV